MSVSDGGDSSVSSEAPAVTSAPAHSTCASCSPALVSIVLGAQWGDEGKGKLVDILATQSDVVCRCQGGSNAGHTVVVGDKTFKFHLMPSGITNPSCKVIIGNGVVLHIPTFLKEIEDFNKESDIPDISDRIAISTRSHIVFDLHQSVDGLSEVRKGKACIGTTKRGIGPTYATKALRNGIRMADLIGDFDSFSTKFRELVRFQKQQFEELEVDIDAELLRYKEYATTLRPMICDTVHLLSTYLQSGSNILIEGANATMLDIDFGTYPYVTSSNCGAGGAATGLGVPVRAINEIYGVVKAYTTRVGAGALPTELLDEIGREIQQVGQEVGTTTGRSRRCGWLDLVVLKYTHMINGYTALAITKLDVLDNLKEIKVGVEYKMNGEVLPSFPSHIDDLSRVEVEYKTFPGWMTSIANVHKFEDLPQNAQAYIKFIEDECRIPIKWVGVGPKRSDMINLF